MSCARTRKKYSVLTLEFVKVALVESVVEVKGTANGFDGASSATYCTFD